MNFAVSPKYLNYADYMLPCERWFRDIDLLDILRTDRDFIQGRLRGCALTSYRDAGKNADKNLSKDEHFALSTLIKNKDLVIQKADQGNVILNVILIKVVILYKKDYSLKMKKILSDISKFHKLSIDQKQVLNHIVNMENKLFLF